jgi:hypothetical protein
LKSEGAVEVTLKSELLLAVFRSRARERTCERGARLRDAEARCGGDPPLAEMAGQLQWVSEVQLLRARYGHMGLLHMFAAPEIVDDLPKTVTGMILRRTLK